MQLVNGSQLLNATPHPATRHCGDVITLSLCTSQRRRRYISNETPNDVSVVRLYNVRLECCVDVSRGRNNNVPPVLLHDASNKSQMKHPTTPQQYVTITS